MAEKLPSVAKFAEGHLSCECGCRIRITRECGLDFVKCPDCSRPNFIPLRVGAFWLYKPLGGGGMGAVYKALGEDGKTECAVKLLPRDKRKDTELIKNLMRECDAARAFGKHPHLVGLIDTGFKDDEYYMATEFIYGERLDRYVESQHQVIEREAVMIISQILEAERHIVSKGYLYRDLKPENIMIEKGGNVRLFDYGLCVQLIDGYFPGSLADNLEGSPFYLPPERIVGAKEGEYSEIYSMGMLLFYMLTGKTYYSQADVEQLVSKHVSAIRITSTGVHLRHCSRNTVSMVDKMIQRNPNSRFPDFNTFEFALKEATTSMPQASQSSTRTGPVDAPSVPSEQVKVTPKNMKMAGIIAASVIGLVIVIMIYSSIMGVVRYNRLVRDTRAKIAKQLSVEPDVPAPPITPQEIEKMIRQRTDEIIAEKTSILLPFDGERAADDICARLKINKFMKKQPDKSAAEIEKELRQELDRIADEKIEKTVLPFNEAEAEKKAAADAGIPLPPPAPSIPADGMAKAFNDHVNALFGEKFGTKALSDAIMKVHEQLGGYKPGDTVKMLDPSGMQLEGKYIGEAGNKIKILTKELGMKEFNKTDIPPAEAWKYNPDICSRKVAEAVKVVKADFNEKKSKFKAEVQDKEKDAFYKSKGYHQDSGTWITSAELLRRKLDAARAAHQAQAEETKRKIRQEVDSGFDKNRHFESKGYRLVAGAWLSEADALQKLLDDEKKAFEQKRAAQLSEIRSAALKAAQEEIYRKNYYISYNGQWVPAATILEQLTMAEVEKIQAKKK